MEVFAGGWLVSRGGLQGVSVGDLASRRKVVLENVVEVNGDANVAVR